MTELNILKKIYEKHLKQLGNFSIPNEKLIICFSGIPGSGKTYIAKVLEKRYNAIRIRSDTIRKIINDLEEDFDNIDEIVYDYIDWLLKSFPFVNKLIILDMSIDRRYEKLFLFFEELGYKRFIIRLKVSQKVYEKRIIKKLEKLDRNYINRINDWKKQYKEFGKKVKPDIIIENNKDNELNLKPLFKKLDRLIK